MNKSKFPNIKAPVRETVVSDEMICYYFDGTNFGSDHSATHRRMILANGVLKNQAGYWNGHTMFHIMIACNLVTKKGNITKRGRIFIHQEFSTNNV